MTINAGQVRGEHGKEPVLYSPIWPIKTLRIRLNSGKAIITEIGREKRCAKCNEYWPADTQFYHSKPSGKDGLQDWCKACYGTWDRERREQKIAKRKSQ